MTTDEKLRNILFAFDDILTKEKATTQMTLSAGIMVIRAAFGQIADDNPHADNEALAEGICETLKKSLLFSIKHTQQVFEA